MPGLPRTFASAAAFVAGITALAFFSLADGPREALGERGARATGVVALMAIWWLFEALPIAVTACVPLVLFPLLGVFEGGLAASSLAAAAPYFDAYIFLFAGGMAIAAAMQQWGLERRIALTILATIGTRPARLLLGVLCATAAISLWISNTATAAMMLPIALALVAQLERGARGVPRPRYSASILLAVAYGANVGGIGTKIGTAPNLQLAGFAAQQGFDVGFFEFAFVGGGFVLLFLPCVWLVLWITGRRDAPSGDLNAEHVRGELRDLGRMQRGERIVLAVFALAALGWIASKPLTEALAPRFGGGTLRSAHVEGAIAMLAAFALLAARAQGRRVLEIASLRRVPWSSLLLLGGSFSMAAAVQSSGLSDAAARALTALRDLGPFERTLLASSTAIAVSAVASNTATIGVLLPCLASALPHDELLPVLFAATLGCSCDFALPAGTPPNAIVFGSGRVSMARMASAGIVLDMGAALVAAAWCAFAVPFVQG